MYGQKKVSEKKYHRVSINKSTFNKLESGDFRVLRARAHNHFVKKSFC